MHPRQNIEMTDQSPYGWTDLLVDAAIIVLENISRVTETRKTYSPNSNSSVRIQGTWTLDPSSTEIDFVTVLVPAWIMEIPGSSNSILNAVSGILHPYTGIIR